MTPPPSPAKAARPYTPELRSIPLTRQECQDRVKNECHFDCDADEVKMMPCAWFCDKKICPLGFLS
jgi:hypothetical protein